MRWRTLVTLAVLGLALHGLVQLVSSACYAVRRSPWPVAERTRTGKPLARSQQPLVSALTRLLDEEQCPEAERWAVAIVRASPSEDLGYLALATAQIRRESRFLSPDLEWLFQQVVPDLVHELGITDPVRTIGPMQVQRWRLQDHFEQVHGRPLDGHTVKQLAVDVESGVAACIAVLDRILVEYLPDRRIEGWVHGAGPVGLVQVPVLARDWNGELPPARRGEALRQKLLSDLTATPLALDGVVGERTRVLLAARPELAETATLRRRWHARYGVEPPLELPPRLAHGARTAFVLADFHSGPGASRVAALQALLRDLFGADLRPDGKWGPLTRAAAAALLATCVPDEAQRLGFCELLTTGHKTPWLREQLLAMARKEWRARHGSEAPDALVPDLWFDGAAQQLKGLGRISVEGYVAGSAAFFEDYLRRLTAYTGGVVPSASGSDG